MREGDRVFVDSGAWIALALTRDPLHERAREIWAGVLSAGARVFTSVPVVLETFTFLDRNARRDVALAWRDAVAKVRRLTVLGCDAEDLKRSWAWFRRKDLHKLSAVDAMSFTLMKRHRLDVAFAFDHHFAAVGFRTAG
ncbi:MAG: PIN domain-containing protein [Planctomycetes bacterium]|nr:PIN domain-containing protein [Planctomycetota bacterium]